MKRLKDPRSYIVEYGSPCESCGFASECDSEKSEICCELCEWLGNTNRDCHDCPKERYKDKI